MSLIHDFGLTHDHFPSAFMQGYDHQYPYQQHVHRDDPHPTHPATRPNYMPRQPSTYFEYAHNPISLLPRGAGFDPRPPHAGWTPKEEVDDDEQSRELLASEARGEVRDVHTRSSPTEQQAQPQPQPPPASTSKTYSFVSLPGNAVRKRPRRRYDEIERLYACSWPDCTKAYGTLNHLNAHVSMQRHGPKRNPAEFKELRKQWRQQKKQDSNTSPVPGAPSTTRRRRATESALSLALPSDMSQGHRLSLGDLRYPPPDDDDGTALGPSPTSTTSDSVAYWQDSPISPATLEPSHHLAHAGHGHAGHTGHTGHHTHHSHHAQSQPHPRASASALHYPVAIPGSSPPPGVVPGGEAGAGGVGGVSGATGLSPPLSRLPPDSTLLTPLPGYRPPSLPSPSSPHQHHAASSMSRLGPGSTLLQPLHASTLAALSPSQDRSPEMHGQRYDLYQDRHSA